MQMLTFEGKQYTVQYSNLRYSHGKEFRKLPGCHGRDQSECKACVRYTIAGVLHNDMVYAGLAKRCRVDQFNNKIGKRISSGRALRAMVETTRYTKVFESTDAFVAFVKSLRKLESEERNIEVLDDFERVTLDDTIREAFGS